MGFNEDLKLILEFEGGYVNNPNDSGGATNKGITQYTYSNYRQNHKLSFNPVEKISDDEVSAIYTDFYNSCGADKVTLINPRLATQLFDFAINAGPTQAIKTLQRSLGVYADGIIGPITLNSINNIIDQARVSKSFALFRVAFYFKLVQMKPSQRQFLMSWLSRPLIIEGLA